MLMSPFLSALYILMVYSLRTSPVKKTPLCALTFVSAKGMIDKINTGYLFLTNTHLGITNGRC